MRLLIIALSLCLGAASAARAQLSIGFSLPGVSIGINVPLYPELVRVPGYPVYYAPGLSANYFFYDGLYWVYQRDNWYASNWYDGPWGQVAPEGVPLFVLRLPVRYYRAPPPYFRGWQRDAPPRWGEHWGPTWQQQRPGWDRWDRRAAPAPAPLPTYQRQYPGRKYPLAQEQQQIRDRNYRHQPRDEVVRQQFQQPTPEQRAPREAQMPQRGDAARQPRPEAAPPPQVQKRERERERGQPPQRTEPTRSQPNRPDPSRDKPNKAEQGRDRDGNRDGNRGRNQDRHRDGDRDGGGDDGRKRDRKD